MTRDEYYSRHILYYYIVILIGGVLIWMGAHHPVYDISTGEMIQKYSLYPIIFGSILIVLSFVGMIFFADIIEGDNDGKHKTDKHM